MANNIDTYIPRLPLYLVPIVVAITAAMKITWHYIALSDHAKWWNVIIASGINKTERRHRSLTVLLSVIACVVIMMPIWQRIINNRKIILYTNVIQYC